MGKNEDFDELLGTLVPFAKEMLSKHGEFYPVGASMSPEGEVQCDAAEIGEEHPPSQQVIDLLRDAYRQQAVAGQIRAACICCDVLALPPGETKKMDALCFWLEHREGDAASVYLPYKRGLFGRYEYGSVFVGARNPEFFLGSGEALP